MARDLVLEVVETVRGNALGDAARDLDTVAKKTDTAAGSARDYSGSLKQLDAQIEQTRSKIRALGLEFVATQEKTVGSELRGERSLLRQLERIRKELSDAGGAAAGAFNSSFLDGLGALPSQGKGLLLVAGLGIGAAMAPVIGAAVSGAVVGAVGAGGIAGGIAAASRSPEVRAAASEFAEAVSGEFVAGGQAFVGPTIESLGILQDAFDDLDLGDSWARVAPYATQLATGIAGMAERFMPGFNRALDEAGPALGILADALPEIGDALGDMLTDISESEGTLEGWAYTLELVEGTIRGTGQVLGWLGDRFHDLVSFAAFMSGALEDIPWHPMKGHMADLNNKFEEVLAASQRGTDGISSHGDQVRILDLRYKALLATYDQYLGNQLSVDQSNQRAAESLMRLKETLADNGKDWRENTKAGQENRAMLTAAVAALIAVREANIANKMPAEQATTQFRAQLDVLSSLATKAGISKEALQDLVGDYYINVHVRASPTAGKSERLSDLLGFQHGGDPPIGEPFWVGEGGRELMVLSPRPHVYSAQQSQAIVTSGATATRQTAQALIEIVNLLRELKTRQPPVININAPEAASPREVAAVVARELAWNS